MGAGQSELLQEMQQTSNCTFYLILCIPRSRYKDWCFVYPSQKHPNSKISNLTRSHTNERFGFNTFYEWSKVSAAEIQRLKKRFMKLDKNGSGAIEKEEFLQIPQIANNPLASRMIAIFDEEWVNPSQPTSEGPLYWHERQVMLARVRFVSCPVSLQHATQRTVQLTNSLTECTIVGAEQSISKNSWKD